MDNNSTKSKEQRRRELNAQYARKWRERNPEAQIRSQIKSLQKRLERMEAAKREAAGE